MGGPLRSEGKDICFPLVPANSGSPDSEFSALPQAKVTLLFPCDPRFPTQSSSLRSSLLAQAAPGFSSPATDSEEGPRGEFSRPPPPHLCGLASIKEKDRVGGNTGEKGGKRAAVFKSAHTSQSGAESHTGRNKTVSTQASVLAERGQVPVPCPLLALPVGLVFLSYLLR